MYKIIFTVFAAVALVFAALGTFMLFGLFFVYGWLVSFDIVNESGVDLWVTPIGMMEGSGLYAPLPRYSDKIFPVAIPLWKQEHDILLESGESLRYTYDYDDINFRHILVRTNSDDIYLVDTDKKGTLHSCYGPQKKKYTIPPLADLRKAPAGLIPCTNGKSVKYSGAQEYP